MASLSFVVTWEKKIETAVSPHGNDPSKCIHLPDKGKRRTRSKTVQSAPTVKLANHMHECRRPAF